MPVYTILHIFGYKKKSDKFFKTKLFKRDWWKSWKTIQYNPFEIDFVAWSKIVFEIIIKILIRQFFSRSIFPSLFLYSFSPRFHRESLRSQRNCVKSCGIVFDEVARPIKNPDFNKFAQSTREEFKHRFSAARGGRVK